MLVPQEYYSFIHIKEILHEELLHFNLTAREFSTCKNVKLSHTVNANSMHPFYIYAII